MSTAAYHCEIYRANSSYLIFMRWNLMEPKGEKIWNFQNQNQVEFFWSLLIDGEYN